MKTSLAPFSVIMVLLSLSCAAPVNRRQVAIVEPTRIPGFSEEYKISEYLEIAAELQAIGKERAVDRLHSWATNYDDDFPVIVLCRMLFSAAPDGQFRPPQIGAPGLLGGTTYSDWPLEPISLVDDTPVLITLGYTLAGRAEPAHEYLSYCLSECRWNARRFPRPKERRVLDAVSRLASTGQWIRPLNWRELRFLLSQATELKE